MFNNYIAKKRELKLSKKLEQSKNQIEWQNKYHSKIQPQLLESYQQRVHSFLYQMHENPIIIEQTTKIEGCSERRGDFIYKNCEDWKSYRTISDRLNMKNLTKNPQKYAAASCKTEFSPNKTEYRIRNKSKQINQPMKFGKIAKQIPQLQRPRHRSLPITRQHSRKSQQPAEDGNDLSHRQITSKQSETNSDFFEAKGISDDIQVDRAEQRKKRSSNQAKRHFKKLMSMVLVGDQKYKKQIKSVLTKCGYIKKKEKNSSQAFQIDYFARIVQKTRQK